MMSNAPAALGPKRRVKQLSKPELPAGATEKTVAHTIQTLALESDHNFKALSEEVNDVRGMLQAIMAHLGIAPTA